MKLNKKGQVLNAIQTGGTAMIVAVVFIVVAAILISFGGKFLEDRQTDLTENSTAYNATGEGLLALQDIAEEQTTYSSVVAIAIVLTILVSAFVGFMYWNRSRG
jgi:type IV secretory pathway VirB2 component (pilin)